MSTEVLNTGAVFALEDRFSAGLDKLIGGLGKAEEQVKALQAQLDKIGLGGMKGLSTKFQAEWDEIGKVTTTGVDSIMAKMAKLGDVSPVFGEMTKGARAAFGEIEALAAALPESVAGKMSLGMDAAAAGMFSPIVAASKLARDEVVANLAGIGGSVEAAAAKMQAAGAGSTWANKLREPGSGFGRAGGGSGLHFGRVGSEVGGVHISTTGNAAMAVAGAALDGVYEAALVDDAVAKALATSQIPIGAGVSQTDAGKRISEMIKNASKSTGFSFHETGESVLEGQRLLSSMGFGKRNDLIEQIMPAAAYEARMKGSSLPEAIEAIIGIAHQTQTYDAAGITKIAKDLAYTSILTPSPLPQFQTALGYSMPELHNGLGMDPGTLMLLTATMQQSGIKGTKSGTWLRSFFENSEPGSSSHNEALRKLGMLNDDDKPSWRVKGADGKVDWEKSVVILSKILQHDQRTIPIDERIGLLRKAYGERGAGFASLMMGEAFTGNLATATKNMRSFKGGEDLLDQYADASILQRSRVALQEFDVAMSDLGTKLMPAATSAVKDFSEIMKAFDAGGPQGFLKLFYDRAVKPDLGPLPDILNGKVSGAPETAKEKFWRMQHGGAPLPPGIQLNAYETFGTNDNGGMVDTLAQGVFRGLTMYATGGGAAGIGGSGGFIKASYGGGGIGNGGFGGPVNNGSPGWWSADRQKHALDVLKAGGVSQMGAEALVSRWMNVEANGGPSSRNSIGAIGIGQWLGNRQAGVTGDFDGQLQHALKELHSSEGRAFGMLNSGSALGAAAGASQFERAEGYNSRTGMDNFTARTLSGMARVHQSVTGIPTVPAPPPRTVSPGVPASQTMAMNLPPIEVHLTHVLDGKVLAKTVTKHQAAGMRFPRNMGGPDSHGTYISPGTPVTDAA